MPTQVTDKNIHMLSLGDIILAVYPVFKPRDAWVAKITGVNTQTSNVKLEFIIGDAPELRGVTPGFQFCRSQHSFYDAENEHYYVLSKEELIEWLLSR